MRAVIFMRFILMNVLIKVHPKHCFNFSLSFAKLIVKKSFSSQNKEHFLKKIDWDVWWGGGGGGHYVLATVWHEPSCLRSTFSCFKLNITTVDQ